MAVSLLGAGIALASGETATAGMVLIGFGASASSLGIPKMINDDSIERSHEIARQISQNEATRRWINRR